MKAQQIKTGDTTPWWTAQSDAVVLGGVVRVRVQHRDGGSEIREWNFDQDVPSVKRGSGVGPHDYQPGETTRRMHTDPSCAVCGGVKH